MRTDPFSVKRFSKLNPVRLGFTAWARAVDWISKFSFAKNALPIIEPSGPLPEAPRVDWSETQVTPIQARHLLYALHLTDNEPGCVIEIGSWRGISTTYLASETTSPLFAIDPFIGPSAEKNLDVFRERTKHLENISLLRMPCGSALKDWSNLPAKFAFIDGSHDYANVAHDLEAIRSVMKPGGLIALHDTDNPVFPGCRRAVYEQKDNLELLFHIKDLTVYRYPNNDGRPGPLQN